MANKRRKKKGSWVKKLLFFVSIPLLVWCAAFLLWLYWNNLLALFTGRPQATQKTIPKAARRSDSGENTDGGPAKRSQEKILDEDRKKLEDILKQRN